MRRLRKCVVVLSAIHRCAQADLPQVVQAGGGARDGEKPQPIRLANPEVVWRSETLTTANEGCLSLPEHYADVERPAEIRLRYIDHENEIREIDAKGLLATCVQHEIDHLDGVLFVDHISALKRNMILRKLAKSKRGRELAPAQ
jgi:peptide deformylase